jgi:hypothetical protein
MKTEVCNGSIEFSDERPLSGIGIQWQLSGDQSEERAVAWRPFPVIHHDQKQPLKNDRFFIRR